jgi:hypothetical protein
MFFFTEDIVSAEAQVGYTALTPVIASSRLRNGTGCLANYRHDEKQLKTF